MIKNTNAIGFLEEENDDLRAEREACMDDDDSYQACSDRIHANNVAIDALEKIDEIKEYLVDLNLSVTEDSDACENDYFRGELDIVDAITDILQGC